MKCVFIYFQIWFIIKQHTKISPAWLSRSRTFNNGSRMFMITTGIYTAHQIYLISNKRHRVILNLTNIFICVYELALTRILQKKKSKHVVRHILGVLKTPYFLAQPLFGRLGSILCCFLYFQVLLFWLLLNIIYQVKSNKCRALL